MCGCNKNKSARRSSNNSTASRIISNNVTRQNLSNQQLVNNGTPGMRAAKLTNTPTSATTASQRKLIEKIRKETLMKKFGK